MPHDVGYIATITAGFSLALIFGYIAERLKMSAIIGFLAAGVAIGPFTPGFVADINLITQLAEIGIMLLMFGVGLHFSISDLMSVKKIAIPGAIFQMLVAILMGAGVATFWGWSMTSSLVFGLCLSVASTVVLLRALESRNLLHTINGKIGIGWLIVEDLVMVLALVLLPPLAAFLSHTDAEPHANLLLSLFMTVIKIVIFVILMLVVGKKLFPRILKMVEKTGSRELFTLCIIAAAVGVAFAAAKLFDVSFALGAFFAGMMLRESEFSHRAATESLPLRDAFSVLFFISVGMLFDPLIAINEPLKLLTVVSIIMVGKTLAAIGLVLAFKHKMNTALTVGASLAQIGEFSFIMAGLSVQLGLLTPQAQSLILAGAFISIAGNAFLFRIFRIKG